MFTYDVDLLATNTMMQIRLEIGDTDSTDQLLQDEEINFALAQETYSSAAAARCCELIALKFARQMDMWLGPQRLYAQQRYEHYRDEAKKLRAKSNNWNAPIAGGVYVNDTPPDAEVVTPIFTKDMMNADYNENTESDD